MTQNERTQRAEAVLRAVDDSDTHEVLDEEAGEVERQSRQVESAFERARRRREASPA
ncbi:hypothetical protein G7072_09390 [Nocardioides sp. HDW12B]|uniref:hypothetical protein n=1 Tax=Nocardioides sp. HDW12B TaxID=2714939 RepID=UPI001407639F|nr:hypothetical protein [Nocardioides sp. HDW12B]QIK66537.1 hypothetical protein G7072_09390 [Nocardioides sp. HDW12B]